MQQNAAGAREGACEAYEPTRRVHGTGLASSERAPAARPCRRWRPLADAEADVRAVGASSGLTRGRGCGWRSQAENRRARRRARTNREPRSPRVDTGAAVAPNTKLSTVRVEELERSRAIRGWPWKGSVAIPADAVAGRRGNAASVDSRTPHPRGHPSPQASAPRWSPGHRAASEDRHRSRAWSLRRVDDKPAAVAQIGAHAQRC